jgi:riboflavin synthase
MFTGLIEDIGTVEAVEAGAEGAVLRISTRLGAELAEGDSVAVDGACLTATSAGADGFEAEAMNQTLRLTSLGSLAGGDRVNLELAVKAGERLGGHILQGHVDGVGEVAEVEADGFARRVRVAVAPELARYAVERGSIGLAGVSLTVSAVGEDWVEVSLIPETLERTVLGGELRPGTRLNVECDIVAKYVERLLPHGHAPERSGREQHERG